MIRFNFKVMRFIRDLVILVLAMTLWSCTQNDEQQSPVTFEFKSRSAPFEYFIATTSDPKTISIFESELKLPFEKRNRFPNGVIERDKQSNQPWSWAFADGWSAAENTIELN